MSNQKDERMSYETGYVYVIEVASLGCVKIGSSRDAEYRFGVIQTHTPGKITRKWFSRPIPDYRECERELHELFKDKKRQGEWFDVPYIEAVVEADRVTTDGSLLSENKRLRAENDLLKEMLALEGEQ